MPMRFGQDRRSAPAGDEAEEDLGQGESGRVAVDRAVVGVEADLDAAAERQAVGEHERRDAEGGLLAEDVVAQLGEQLRHLDARDVAHPAEIGSRGEDERLAGDGDRVDLTATRPLGELVEHAAELQQGGGPRVFGRVWSRPLSSVTRARVLPLGSGTSFTNAWVTTSSPATTSRGLKSILL